MTEIEAAINGEREAQAGLGFRDAFFGKGNFIRFAIAFTIFLLRQWSGQNSVGYYAPQMFTSVRHFTKNCATVNRQSLRLGIRARKTHCWPQASME